MKNFLSAVAASIALSLPGLPAVADAQDLTLRKPDLFCPARVQSFVPISQLRPENGEKDLGNDVTFGVVLRADAAKNISGAMSFLSGGKIYTAPFATSLSRMATLQVMYQGKTSVSHAFDGNPVYVTFPERVAVDAAWVSQTTSAGKTMDCSALPIVYEQRKRTPDVKFTDSGLEDAQIRAQATAPVKAVYAETIDLRNCPAIATDAKMTSSAVPQYPRTLYPASGSSIVRIALNAQGDIADAAILSSSGFREFDEQAVAAAALSKYMPRQFLCKPVPGFYTFRANFRAW